MVDEFHVEYSKQKIAKWQAEIEILAIIAKTQSQAAYAAYTHDEKHRFSQIQLLFKNYSRDG